MPEAVDENINAIKVWEDAAYHDRSAAERISDVVTRVAGSGGALIAHAVWFGGWIVINTGSIGAVTPFDPFPFPLLTMIVSLEAIFLSLIVLAGQNRLSRQADKRAELDLQIDMLAEGEMTAVLVVLQDLARHLDARLSLTPEQLRDLASRTDIDNLTRKLEQLPGE